MDIFDVKEDQNNGKAALRQWWLSGSVETKQGIDRQFPGYEFGEFEEYFSSSSGFFARHGSRNKTATFRWAVCTNSPNSSNSHRVGGYRYCASPPQPHATSHDDRDFQQLPNVTRFLKGKNDE